MNPLRFVILYFILIPIWILLTPIRWIFDIFTITHPDLFRKSNNSNNHDQKVKKVQAQVQEWKDGGRKSLMCTARPSWQTLSMRNLNKTKFTQIQIDLEDIIEIDEENMILRVEPGMKMGTLTYKLLSLGWTIPVIPEFESLTIGGCVNGTGIETSSHKFGLFADTCLEFELVLSDGSLVVCSKIKNADLFYTIPWSHGTLGFLTSVTIPIQRAAKFVKVEYKRTNCLEDARALLQENTYDFVEGIMFSPRKIVVMHGTLVNEAESDKINYINRWYKPWFYLHVKSKFTRSLTSEVEFLPLRDYYHRHQRAYFWELEGSCPAGKKWWFQFLFGWMYPINFQLGKIFTPEFLLDWIFIKEKHVLQDFLVPISKLDEILQLAHTELEVYPIWLCPCKFFESPGLASLPEGTDSTYVDIGIYGITPKSKFDIEKKIRKFEKVVTECNGYQFLYADTYMTRAEFEKMFKMKNYFDVRRNYNCQNAFPEVYDKISKNSRTK